MIYKNQASDEIYLYLFGVYFLIVLHPVTEYNNASHLVSM